MKNLLIIFCSLLLLSGVFGADEVNVSVMEGGSVTLEINEDIIRATDLKWKFNTDTVIARIDLEVKNSPAHYTDDERFRGRLKLDPQTGSLTITDIRTQHSGEYKLQIIGSREPTLKIFRVSVSDKVMSVSVMEGGSVTLPTDVTDGMTDDVKWKFNGADLTESSNIEVNPQTGILKIRNIRFDQSGEYKVKINGGSFIIHRTFSVTVSGEEKKSVMEGDDVTLHTDVTRLQKEDVVQWRFNDALIAHLDKTTEKIQYDAANKRFTDRLNIDQTGSLIITNIRSGDSGVYEVNITGSKIIHKRFNVTVSASNGRSSGEKTGPGLLVVLILMSIIMIL